MRNIVPERSEVQGFRSSNIQKIQKLRKVRGSQVQRVEKFRSLEAQKFRCSKLNHSIEGLYDSVVNNLFKLDFIDNKDIYFQIYMPKEYQIYNSYFKEIILDKRIDRKTLKLLTANLFLSMLPMHIEDNKKIVGLALLGSIFMTELSMEKIIS